MARQLTFQKKYLQTQLAAVGPAPSQAKGTRPTGWMRMHGSSRQKGPEPKAELEPHRNQVTAESLEAIIHGGRQLIIALAQQEGAISGGGGPYRSGSAGTADIVRFIEGFPDIPSMVGGLEPKPKALILGAAALDEGLLDEGSRKEALGELIGSSPRCEESRRMLGKLGFSDGEIRYLNHQMEGASGSSSFLGIISRQLMGRRRRRELLEKALHEVEKAYDLIVKKEAKEQGKSPLTLVVEGSSPGDPPWHC